MTGPNLLSDPHISENIVHLRMTRVPAGDGRGGKIGRSPAAPLGKIIRGAFPTLKGIFFFM